MANRFFDTLLKSFDPQLRVVQFKYGDATLIDTRISLSSLRARRRRSQCLCLVKLGWETTGLRFAPFSNRFGYLDLPCIWDLWSVCDLPELKPACRPVLYLGLNPRLVSRDSSDRNKLTSHLWHQLEAPRYNTDATDAPNWWVPIEPLVCSKILLQIYEHRERYNGPINWICPPRPVAFSQERG